MHTPCSDSKHVCKLDDCIPHSSCLSSCHGMADDYNRMDTQVLTAWGTTTLLQQVYCTDREIETNFASCTSRPENKLKVIQRAFQFLQVTQSTELINHSIHPDYKRLCLHDLWAYALYMWFCKKLFTHVDIRAEKRVGFFNLQSFVRITFKASFSVLCIASHIELSSHQHSECLWVAEI